MMGLKNPKPPFSSSESNPPSHSDSQSDSNPLPRSLGSHPPRPISELVKLAKLPFDPKLPIKAYIKSASMLYQQATSLLAQDQLEPAFIYLVRASTIIIDDLPSKHPDYPLLPPTFKGLLQADGHKYMDALVPLKSQLANRHTQYFQRSPPPSILPNTDSSPLAHSPPKPVLSKYHSKLQQRPPHVGRTTSSSTSYSNLSTAPTSTSSPQPSIPQKSASHNHSTPDRYRSSRALPSNTQHSSPSTPSSNPSQSRSPLSIRKNSSHSSLDQAGDWELVEQPTPYYPARLHKKPPSRTARAPEDWPVELGGGQGTRMSVALPPSNAGTNALPPTFPLTLAQSAALHYARHPPRTNDATTLPTDRSSAIPAARPRPPLSSSSRSTRDSQRLSEAYSEIERVLSRDNPQPYILTPPPRAPWISSPTSASTSNVNLGPRSNPLRMTMSTDNLLHGQRSTPDSRSPPFSGFKALITRPRQTSLTTSPKPFLKSSPPFSPIPPSPEPSPLGSSMQPRVRRGSYDPSTWRWLKALAPKLSSHPPSEFGHPQQNDLYAEPGPPTPAQDVVVQPLRDFSLAQPPPPPSTSDKRGPVGSSASRTGASKKSSSNSLLSFSKRGPNASAPALVPPAPFLPSAPPLAPPVPPKEPGMRFKSDKRTDGLREMVCPEELVGTFMEIARPETERGVELCGLLLGKLVGERELVVTTLMVPKQVSKADSCATTHEEEVFEYQTKWGLMTLGWIHTHPTQTCFMSSVDLHTHCSYQLMLPEAVAIVCSPNKDPSVGVFRLTDPPGIQVIRACREESSSTFHVHPAGIPLYTDADASGGEGHFRMKTFDQAGSSGKKQEVLEVIDLRQI